jgi:hypothetical protein
MSLPLNVTGDTVIVPIAGIVLSIVTLAPGMPGRRLCTSARLRNVGSEAGWRDLQGSVGIIETLLR